MTTGYRTNGIAIGVWIAANSYPPSSKGLLGGLVSPVDYLVSEGFKIGATGFEPATS